MLYDEFMGWTEPVFCITMIVGIFLFYQDIQE